jgi:SPP1 gp7 family putative phage head morphogenesis protein
VLREIDPILLARGARRDAVSVAELFRTLETRPNARAILERLFAQTDREGADALRKQLPGVPLPAVVSNGAALRERWVSRNTDLIRATEPIKRAVRKVIDQPLDQGLRVEDIRKQLIERMGIEKRRAQRIARDQTLKLAGQLQQARQEQAGIRRYVWTTSADERVRPDHAELDGRVFAWAEPPVVDKRTQRRGHPGSDFQCRCTADPVLDDLEEDPTADPGQVAETDPVEAERQAGSELPRPPSAELEAAPAAAFAAPAELVANAELTVTRGLRPLAAAEAEAAVANALPGRTLEALRAIPFDATQLNEDPALMWLRTSEFFRRTGDVPDNFGSSRGGLPQITIEATGKVYLSNGRHRLTVARELGLRQIVARLQRLGPRGGVLWEYVGLVRI